MKKLLLTTLFLSIGCDSGEMKTEACKTAFDDQLACHKGVIQESCWAICDEIYAICIADEHTEGCNLSFAFCKDRCHGFNPVDPTRAGMYPERDAAFYTLESCQTPEDRDLVCS